MSAVLLRRRPDPSALTRIALQSSRLHTSGRTIPRRSVAARGLPLQRRSIPQCLPSSAALNGSRLSVRHKSTTAKEDEPRAKSPIMGAVVKAFAYCGFFIVMSGAAVVAFFIYDSTTYGEDGVVEDIPVSELALNPRRGGPKNLPIAEFLIGDHDSEEMMEQKDKPRLVILGTGWGSVALLKQLNPGDYHVTVVSPTNYFLFTPMLPSATVGTLGLRSLVEPVRRIVQRVRGHFLKGEAVDVDFSEKLVAISRTDTDGKPRNFYVPYDKLVIGVGMFPPPPSTDLFFFFSYRPPIRDVSANVYLA